MRKDISRRRFLLGAGAGATCLFLGGTHVRAATYPFSVLPEDTLSAFTITAGNPAPDVSIVVLQSERFDRALRMQVVEAPTNPYEEGEEDMWVAGRTSGAITKGDLLELSFWARAAQSADGQAEFRLQGIERFGGPYFDFSRSSLAVGSEWQEFVFRFNGPDTLAPGEGQVRFFPGYEPQTIDVAGLSLLNYGPAAAPPQTYAGREPDARWRRSAEQRIEHIRKGRLTVTVEDSAGKPLGDAEVKVRMLRHEFGFGSAVRAPLLMRTTADAAIYRAKITELFNKVVFENDLKWPQWENERVRAAATLPALNWLRERNIAVRGHVLVWPGWRLMPTDVYELRNDPAALRNRIDSHIAEATSALRGQLVEWDVLNEPYRHHVLMDILGREEMARWFQLTRAADPDVKLYINDFGTIEDYTTWRERHQDFYYDTIQDLLDRGAPVDGIGMQAHFANDATAPEQVLAILDRFATFGKPIQVTEYDFLTSDEQLQADFTRDFMTALFSHPMVNGFVMWGFWGGAHWRAGAEMFRTDWTIKPNGQVYQDLVFNQWWTNADGRSDKQGRYVVEGFRGDYAVEVTVNGVTKTVNTTLPKQGTKLTVAFD